MVPKQYTHSNVLPNLLLYFLFFFLSFVFSLFGCTCDMEIQADWGSNPCLCCDLSHCSQILKLLCYSGSSFFFFGTLHQGLDQRYSCDLCCSNARCLTNCAPQGSSLCPRAPELPLIPLCHRGNSPHLSFLIQVTIQTDAVK